MKSASSTTFRPSPKHLIVEAKTVFWEIDIRSKIVRMTIFYQFIKMVWCKLHNRSSKKVSNHFEIHSGLNSKSSDTVCTVAVSWWHRTSSSSVKNSLKIVHSKWDRVSVYVRRSKEGREGWTKNFSDNSWNSDTTNDDQQDWRSQDNQYSQSK